jgi:hypothetical protein
MMRCRALYLAAAGLFAVTGAVHLLRSCDRAKSVARHSALLGLQQQVIDRLEQFRNENGTYPRSLDELTIDYSQTDGASSEYLQCFRFESTGTHYSLERQVTSRASDLCEWH